MFGLCKGWKDFKEYYEKEYLNKNRSKNEPYEEAGNLVLLFSYLPYCLDRLFRKKDYGFNKVVGGKLEKLGIKGHSILGLLLPAVLLIFIINGPSWRNVGILSVCLILFSVLILWFLMFKLSPLDAPDTDNPEESSSQRKKLCIAPLLAVASVAFVLCFKIYLPVAGVMGTSLLAGFFILVLLITSVGWGLNPEQRRGLHHFGSWVMWAQLALFVVTGAVVWRLAGAGLEAEGGLYRHILVPLVLLLLVFPLTVATIMARSVVRREIARLNDTFLYLIKNVEVFKDGGYNMPQISGILVWRNILNSLHHPLELILIPCMVIFLPHYGQEVWVIVSVFIVVWANYAMAGLYERLATMLDLYRRTFFDGSARIVSFIVIALALGRIMQISYIETVMVGSPLTLSMFILVAYFVAWYSQYWFNRIFGEEYLALFNDKQESGYRFGYQFEGKSDINVLKENRYIQFHGGSRIIVVGKYRKSDPDGNQSLGEAFHTFRGFHLLEELAREAEPEVIEGIFCSESESMSKGMPSVSGSVERLISEESNKAVKEKRSLLLWHIRHFRNQYKFYVSFINFVFYFGLVVFALGIRGAEQNSAAAPVNEILENGKPQPVKSVDLEELLFKDSKTDEKDKKVIMLAVSGGGTRAALYGTSILHGLHQIKRLDDVILASGVSGGGASLAYFGEHREALIAEKIPGKHWKKYYQAMSHDYIMKCISGSSEWRLVGGTRLGRLLDEELDRKMRKSDATQTSYLSSVEGIGLIFSTSVCGENRQNSDYHLSLSEWDAKHRDERRSWYAGTRLVFTNLKFNTNFQQEADLQKYDFRYIIAPRRIKLSSVAALNANFPPVFSNAPVDIGKTRYWVTDGGAVENRGAISLLYALREVLERIDERIKLLEEKIKKEEKDISEHTKMVEELKELETKLNNAPDIHLIIADASGVSYDSKDDNGMGAFTSSASKLGSGLIQELLRDVKKRYSILTKRKIICEYLPMPLVFRSRGGIGTHWMLPKHIRYRQNKAPTAREDKKVTLSQAQTMSLIASLHSEQNLFPSSEQRNLNKEKIKAENQVKEWVLHDYIYLGDKKSKVKSHAEKWKQLKETLAK